MYIVLFFLSSIVFSQFWNNHPELNWHTIETEHFLIHYHDETYRSAIEASIVAERIYRPVTELYDFEPESKTDIIIKDTDDMSNGSAYYYDNKIEIWALPMDYDLRGSHRWINNVITHEFIHIVQIGDTITSISKLYSINKDLIIKLNNLKDENYIFVGQNLIISESSENLTKQSDLIKNYHIVDTGENLTDISNKYNLKVKELIEINNINNADSIKIGQKLTIRKKNTINSEKYETTENKKNNDLIELDKKIYGPIIIQSKTYKDIKGRKVLNVLNQENKKLIISINCDKNELDVRIPGRKWMGSKPVKEEFENNLINDFC